MIFSSLINLWYALLASSHLKKLTPLTAHNNTSDIIKSYTEKKQREKKIILKNKLRKKYKTVRYVQLTKRVKCKKLQEKQGVI